jgi:hypothetical protein
MSGHLTAKIRNVALTSETVRFEAKETGKSAISEAWLSERTVYDYGSREYWLGKRAGKYVYGGQTVLIKIKSLVHKFSAGCDRQAKLDMAYHDCNRQKTDHYLKIFLKRKPEPAEEIQIQVHLKTGAAISSTRRAVFILLTGTGRPVLMVHGGSAKFTRSKIGTPKTPAPETVYPGKATDASVRKKSPLMFACRGPGPDQRTRLMRYGFPNGHRPRSKTDSDSKPKIWSWLMYRMVCGPEFTQA